MLIDIHLRDSAIWRSPLPSKDSAGSEIVIGRLHHLRPELLDSVRAGAISCLGIILNKSLHVLRMRAPSCGGNGGISDFIVLNSLWRGTESSKISFVW